VNDEDLDFDSISIAFFSCVIDDLEVENIISKNITVGFYGSILKGTIRSENISCVELNNCILNKTIFISGVQKTVIKFTKENIQLYRWKRLFKQHRINSYADLLEK